MSRKKTDLEATAMNEPATGEAEVEFDLEELAAAEEAEIAEAKVQPMAASPAALYCQDNYPAVVIGGLGRFERGVPRELEVAIGDDLVARKGFRRVDA